MQYFENEFLGYKENKLYCEDIYLGELAEKYGTPLYVYSKNFMKSKYDEFSSAFKDISHKIFFATKANFNINVIKLFADLGGGIDVNSAGELFRALKAGVNPDNILLTGVGKTDEEIRLGLENGVLMIKAESLQEVYLINRIASEMGKIAPVAFRVNPDVDAETHPYISTGLAENKFGIPANNALDIFVECSLLNNVNICGIDMHIGSQIVSIGPYVESVMKMVELTKQIISKGINIEHLDIGGGYGITYKDEKPFTPSELAEALLPVLMQLDCGVFFEPGRFLTANGGVLLTKVLYTKSNGVKNFIVVDGAMTDMLRPSIYNAYHHIQPVLKSAKEDITADIVGPVCESGDFLGKDRTFTKAGADEIIAVMSAGAYGMVMASNYNARRKAPEIIVDGDKYYLTRSRETFEHLLYDEKIIADLHK
jgi:diaminopimelate decarboxylase